jgi:CubicO group peptidase (beta-lactamase class C family)
MVFCLVFISPALAETLPSTVPEAVGFSSERLNRIDATLLADIDKGKIEGAVVLIARKGKIAYFKNFGMRNREAGLPLDQFLDKRIFQPLGMTDTGFNVSESDLNRVAYLNPKTFLYTDLSKPTINFSGGGGAVSTTMDYANFAQMLLNRGKISGTRLLEPETVAYMTSDHLGPLGKRPDRGYTSRSWIWQRVWFLCPRYCRSAFPSGMS